MSFRILSAAAIIGAALGPFAGSASAQQQPWTFDALLPTTGVNAGAAEEVRLGLTLALERINKEGGIKGHQIKFELLDTQSNPGQVANLIRKACDESMIAFTSVSADSQVGFPVANSVKCPAVGINSAAAGLTAKNRPWAFSMLTPANVTTPMAVAAMIKKLGAKSAALFVERTDPSAMSYAAAATEAMTKAGIKQESVSVTSADVDFGPAATRAASSNPDFVFVSGMERASVGVIKEIHRSQMKSKVVISMGAWNGAVASLGDEYLKGSWRFAPSDPMASDDPKVQQFVKDYMSRSNGRPPTLTSTLGYDALMLVKFVIEKTDIKGEPSTRDADRQKFIDAMNQVKGWDGLGGKMSMTPEGYMIADPVLLEYAGGGRWKQIH